MLYLEKNYEKLQNYKKNIKILTQCYTLISRIDFMEWASSLFLWGAKYENALAVTDFGIIHPAKGQRF